MYAYAANCYRPSRWYVGRSAGLSVTVVRHAKAAESINMLFGYGLVWAQGTMY